MTSQFFEVVNQELEKGEENIIVNPEEWAGVMLGTVLSIFMVDGWQDRFSADDVVQTLAKAAAKAPPSVLSGAQNFMLFAMLGINPAEFADFGSEFPDGL